MVDAAAIARPPVTSAGPSRRRGFTLVEMLVAVAIFAIASGLAYGGLAALTRARSQLAADNERLGRLQFAFGLIERDLRSVVARPIRDGQGAPLGPLVGARERVELSRLGQGDSLGLARSAIERVGYRLERGVLRRERFAVLDRVASSQPIEDELLDRVTSLEWTYLANDGRELAQWPSPREPIEALPRAVSLVVRFEDYGEIRRVLELPEEARP